MGKPYSNELDELPRTYSWCLRAEVGALAECLDRNRGHPLLAVGSGGSFTAAAFAAFLHQNCTGQIAKSITPLEALLSPLNLRDLGVLILTAGGKNPDVLGCLSKLLEREPRTLAAICTRGKSPLAILAARSRRARTVEFDLPTGKDGFLATNSLLATIVLLTRAAREVGLARPILPETFEELLGPTATLAEFRQRLSVGAAGLWGRQSFIVLHTPATQAAALDLESRFSEAALGHVQVADYRNFGHGRHYWLAARGESTGIVSFITEDTADLAERTLRLVPEAIPVLRVRLTEEGLRSSLSGILHSMFLAELAGRASGVDPGRPTVPEFGRRLYRLPAFRKAARRPPKLTPNATVAIERKSRAPIGSLESSGQLSYWVTAHRSFVSSLSAVHFAAVVLDYDGTLCESHERFQGPGAEVIKVLEWLLKAGVVVGVATGRGRSVQEQLRDRIEASLWSRVPVAYHNGSEVGLLSDDAVPGSDKVLSPLLQRVADILAGHPLVADSCAFETSRNQLTLESRSRTLSIAESWGLVRSLVEREGAGRVRVLRSDHSIDILGHDTSKLAVLRMVAELSGVRSLEACLCVGDRGCWPGNDCDLLSQPYSLSVDEASSDPKTCWNLATPGTSHTGALLEYLGLLECVAGRAFFPPERSREAFL